MNQQIDPLVVPLAQQLDQADRSLRHKWSALKELSKSGIVTLVLITVTAGYLAGHSHQTPFDTSRFFLTLIGILFLSSGSSALNQFQERERDKKMPRTANRPLPSGRISSTEALVIIGFSIAVGLILLAQVSLTQLALGLVAVASYNGLYTLWWKRSHAHAAIPGAIPGALPILMGYSAAAGKLWTPGGLYLFGLLFFWQMPHFWVLAIKYQEDYRKGGFPTLPVARGTEITTQEITLWGLGYIALSILAPLFLPVGGLYIATALLLGFWLLWELFGFARAPESKRWLRFFLGINLSLIVYLGALVCDLWLIRFPGIWVN